MAAPRATRTFVGDACRSGGHDASERRTDARGYLICRACRREDHQYARLILGVGRWSTPRIDVVRLRRWQAVAASLAERLADLRTRESFDGRRQQWEDTLGDPSLYRPVRGRR